MLINEKINFSLRKHPILAFFTGALGVTSKLYALIVFLVSIRAISKLFESNLANTELAVEATPSIFAMPLDLSPYFFGIILLLAFLMVGVLDYWFLKVKSVFTVYCMGDFDKHFGEELPAVTPADRKRALNTYRLVIESWIGACVFTVVCLCAVLCLFWVNLYFGIFVLASFSILFLCAQLIPKSTLRSLANLIPQVYGAKIHAAVDSEYVSMAEIVTTKYDLLYLQQSAFILTHALVGMTLASLVIFNSLGYLEGIGIFEIVVFIYTVRFVSNNGRNALVAYFKFKSHSTATYGYLA